MNTLFQQISRSTSLWQWLWMVVLGLGGTAALIFMAIEGQVRLAFAMVFLGILLGLACINVYWSILATFGYLTFLGDLRRWLLTFEEWSGADPLLVVGGIVAVVLWAVAVTSDRVKFDTPLSKWVLLLIAIMALQVFNPVQGGLLVGMTGAVFLLVPLLWYWVGKSFGNEEFMQTLFFRLIVPLACLAALFGFYQVIYGYPEYQLEWYRPRADEYVALGPNEEYLRPLSIFPNITEYLNYLGAAAIALLALVLRKQSILGPLLLVGFLFAAMFVSGTRGPVLFLIVTGIIMWTLLGRTKAVWVPRLAIALVIGFFGLTYGLDQVAQTEGEGRMQFNIERQAELIPEGESGGTISIHLNLLGIGAYRTMNQPLGHGTGYITLAAGRFGDGGFSTEKDFMDMFIALGIPGGVVYLIVLAYATLLAVRYWTRTRSTIGLIILGLLVFSVFGWLAPGRYVMTPLIWFCVGALDRIQSKAMNASENVYDEPHSRKSVAHSQ